jgi:cytochrome c peroxidase
LEIAALVRQCVRALPVSAASIGLAFAAGNSGDYEWQLPPGFPVPDVPRDNPMSVAKVELGRRLFNDTRLSRTGSYACASCHRRELAFTDGRAQARGATGEQVRRSAMTLTNVAYNAALTWGDPRVHSLEAQMQTPLFGTHPVEMGLPSDGGAALSAIANDATYRAQFAQVFTGGHPVSMAHIIQAIAAYERTLISGRAPFDRYVFDDEPNALTDSAKRGMRLFFSQRVGCSQCHFGINFAGPIRTQDHVGAKASFANNGLYNVDGRGSYPKSDRGLWEVTKRGADMGKFRVPTLRNVALTAPYMHDGSLPTLRAVLAHYMRGGEAGAHRDPRLHPFQLSEPEQDDLLSFLDSLSDRTFVLGVAPSP